MNLNYTAFLLISFVPILIGYLWYHPQFPIAKWSGQSLSGHSNVNPLKLLACLIMSITIVYGYINIVIHQMGFYELFFTDIMKGSEEAKTITKEFLSQYGDKHRSFGHGVFHGIINAFVFALPFIFFHALMDNRDRKYLLHHFSYWLIVSVIISGLISEFV